MPTQPHRGHEGAPSDTAAQEILACASTCLMQEVEARMQELSRKVREIRTSTALGRKVLVDGLVDVLGVRDSETRSHSLRVARYAVLLGRALGLAADEIDALELGAILHDIGKIVVADRILLKPGRLTEAEWQEMRRHPAHGLRILARVGFPRPASEVVGQHHERYDGTGYPARLRDEQISPLARIFAVADAFDAMTSDRPYRTARGVDTALAEIEESLGTQLDPRIAAMFLRLPRTLLDDIRLGQRDSEAELLALRRRCAALAG